MTTLTESKSFQSECQLLGSMFLDPNIIPAVQEIVLDNGYFANSQNRIIFDLLIELHNEGVRPDLIVLRNKLEQRHRLKSVGGVEYLVKVIESVATPANYAIHAKHVRDCYLERRLSGLKETIEHVEAEPGSVVEKINTVCRDFTELQSEIKARSADNTDGLMRLIDDAISGRKQFLNTNWPLLDSLTRFLTTGTVSLICGNPGASKSFMLLQCLSQMLEIGIPSALLELEESRGFHALRALAQKTNFPQITDSEWMHCHESETRRIYSENQGFVSTIEKAIEAPDCQLTFPQIVEWVRRKAKGGCKFIGIDPITAAQATRRETWSEHNDFLQAVKQIAVEYNTAVVFVTHPIKTVLLPDINQLAGSAAFGRFCQTVLWLEFVGEISGPVKTRIGTIETGYNRVLHILKARNCSGQGLRIACEFDENLWLREVGLIVSRKGY